MLSEKTWGLPPYVAVVQATFKYEHLFKYGRRGDTHSLSPLARVGGLGQTTKFLTQRLALDMLQG